ncbi:MAG TPA: hypothetical protein HPP87_01485 [Planctomycetes bacterium]|nr:hypothetical protein [Planctomycetota bacterium]HIJ70017.1 hypothetical protein [Planctomycetota bacterium]
MKKNFGTLNVRILSFGVIAVALVTAVVALLRLDYIGEKGSGLGKEFIYDIESLTKIDPELLIYQESGGAISTGFTQSSAIAAQKNSPGRFYVAGDSAVKIFSEQGEMLDRINLETPPGCLAVGNDGLIYVGLKEHVEIFNGQSNRLARWPGLGAQAVLTSIAVYKENVFVADAGNRVVVRYDKAGNIVNYIGTKDEEKGIQGFVVPSPYFDLAVAGDGLLRVVNPGRHRIEAYTFNGDLEFWWGKASAHIEGFCGCCNPVNFAILDDDSFITCEKGLKRVKLYDADGVFVGVVAGPEQLTGAGQARICDLPAQCRAGGFDVAVNTEGRVLVLDTIENTVRVFNRIKTR